MEQKTKIGETVRSVLLITGLAALAVVPAALLLTHIALSMHFAGPQWCNVAGGCPWK